AEELITNYPFIRYTKRAWVGQLIDRFLQQRQFRVKEGMTLDTLEAITTMVHYGLGVSIIPMRERNERNTLPVRYVQFRGQKEYRTIGTVSMPGNDKERLIEAILSELKAVTATGQTLPRF